MMEYLKNKKFNELWKLIIIIHVLAEQNYSFHTIFLRYHMCRKNKNQFTIVENALELLRITNRTTAVWRVKRSEKFVLKKYEFYDLDEHFI